MKVGIISDTHINKDISKLSHITRNFPGGADYIIHAGDYTSIQAAEILMEHNHFVGVFGNADEEGVKALLKEKEIIELEGCRIGVFHGHGQGKTTIDRAYEAFQRDHVDIIIFGHSHQPVIVTKNGVLMLNPGSPTSKRKERWFSYILLELEGKLIRATLNFF